ncbi:hypothetical protein cypCar_00046934, partial [Cyprinus carpio]
MEIKTILFVILNAHTCTAIFNGPSGRSFFVQRVYETQTDEPFDYNMDETSPDSSLMPNKTHEEIRQQASQSNKRAHPCINTDLNAAKCNRTKVLVFNISDEAADFLKGPMATRIMPLVLPSSSSSLVCPEGFGLGNVHCKIEREAASHLHGLPGVCGMLFNPALPSERSTTTDTLQIGCS